MTKSSAVRLSDTIAFIRTATVPTAHNAKRQTVADMLEDRETAGTINMSVSQHMSQGSNYSVFDRDAVQTVRHYRRALILIGMVLDNAHHTMIVPDTAQIADANLPAALGTALDNVVTVLTDLQQKLNLLKANPLQFLANNAFNMTGAHTTGVVAYALYFDAMQNRYNLIPESDAQTYVYVAEPAFHLGVNMFATLPKTSKGAAGGDYLDIPGTVVHGANLMVTTQLTGCSVPYYLNGAMLVAAHVQPNGAGNGEASCTDLRNDGRLLNAPALTGVFGPQTVKGVNVNNYQKNLGDNYCVGVRIAGSWELYAQQRTRGSAGGGQVAWQIT